MRPLAALLLALLALPLLAWLLAVACDRHHRFAHNARLVWRGIVNLFRRRSP